MKRVIKPHKGGRSVVITVRALPEIKALLKEIARANGKTPADMVELWTKENANMVEQAPE